MPGGYGGRGRGRRRYRRRRGRKNIPGRSLMRWGNRAMGAWALAKAAWSGVNYIRGLVNSEVHKFSSSATPTVDSSGSVTHLTAIAIGDTASTRTGNSIFVRYLYPQYTLTLNASATDTFVRLIFFYDTQQVADTAPTVANVLESVSHLSSLNNDNKGRFQILADRRYSLQAVDVTSMIRKLYLPLKLHINYNGSAGTDQQKNALYLLAISNEATNVPTLSINWRVGFHDN